MCHSSAPYSIWTKSKESGKYPVCACFNNNINVASINCRSVRNKTSEIVDYVADNNVDILGLTET